MMDIPIETKVPRVWAGALLAVEQAADWAGVDPDQLVGLILRDWLWSKGLAEPTFCGPLPTVDWAMAQLLRRVRGTDETYGAWRAAGNRLLNDEGNIGLPNSSIKSVTY
jgi:hypothetical protein